ncbi:hypothetical protein IM725_05970 [Ramlibacter aquaticus]|uniref:ParM/StbA family protein n=2 Tax=Ramlibacter TaxID=174951 RepID=A0ABR9SCU3_9BURK|nr:plasmid segregation protein ParM domain-containing protein [Ramlibacter aquaticus]MBE7940115.1 hypothetical protein [Ramlibacter aquaticus]
MKPEQHFTIPAAAIDVGYFNTKYAVRAAADKPMQCGLFPSIAPVLQSEDVDTIDTKERHNGFVVTIDGLHYFVGEDATALASAFEPRHVERNYVKSGRYLALARGALAHIGQLARATGPVRIAHLVVGLPLSTYRIYRDDLKARLQGVHEVPNYRGRGTMTVTVEDVRVLMQPAGALIHFADKSGDQLEGASLVCDIGGGTMDYLVTTDGFLPNGNRSGANEFGVLSYCSAVAEKLDPDWVKETPMINMVDKAIRERTAIKAMGVSYPVEQYWPVLQRSVQSALSVMHAKVQTFNDLNRVIMVGGGAEVFAEVLVATHPKLKPIMRIEADSVMSNVRGFCSAAERVAASASRAGQSA